MGPTLKHYNGDDNYVYNQDVWRIYFCDPDSPSLNLWQDIHALNLYEDSLEPYNDAVDILKERFHQIITNPHYFTEKQYRIIELVLFGKTQEEAAEILGISQATIVKTLIGNQVGKFINGGVRKKVHNLIADMSLEDEELKGALDKLKIKVERAQPVSVERLGKIWVKGSKGKVRGYNCKMDICYVTKISGQHFQKLLYSLNDGEIVKAGEWIISLDKECFIPTLDLYLQQSRLPIPAWVNDKGYPNTLEAVRRVYPGDKPAQRRASYFIKKVGYYIADDGRVISKKPTTKAERKEMLESVA